MSEKPRKIIAPTYIVYQSNSNKTTVEQYNNDYVTYIQKLDPKQRSRIRFKSRIYLIEKRKELMMMLARIPGRSRLLCHLTPRHLSDIGGAYGYMMAPDIWRCGSLGVGLQMKHLARLSSASEVSLESPGLPLRRYNACRRDSPNSQIIPSIANKRRRSALLDSRTSSDGTQVGTDCTNDSKEDDDNPLFMRVQESDQLCSDSVLLDSPDEDI